MTNDRISTFVRECQLFAGHALVVRASATHRALVEKFVSRLPSPDNPLETVVMDDLLFKVAARWSQHVHEQLHVDKSFLCDFNADADLVDVWRIRHTCPVHSFSKWATLFLDKIEQSHRPPLTLHVKEIINRGIENRMSVRSLARDAGCHPVRLRATFKRDVGMSIREYQTRRRILRAAQLLVESDVKVDAIARAAGFSNRKNFYKAFKRALHTNPSAVRNWSGADLEAFEERLFPRTDSHEQL